MMAFIIFMLAFGSIFLGGFVVGLVAYKKLEYFLKDMDESKFIPPPPHGDHRPSDEKKKI